MKKKHILALFLVLFLTACSEKDKEYYLANPEKIEEKITLCKEKLDLTSPECKAAIDAQSILRKQKQKQARAEAMEKYQAQLAEAQKQVDSEYGNMDWLTYEAAFSKIQCSSRSYDGYYFPTLEQTKCLVMEERYKKLNEEAEEKLSNIPFDTLITEGDTYCKLNIYSVPCKIWGASLNKSAEITFKDIPYMEYLEKQNTYCAEKPHSKICSAYNNQLNKKYNLLVQFYMDNDEEFKKEFAVCYKKAREIKEYGMLGPGTEVALNDPLCKVIDQVIYNRGLLEYRYFPKPLE